LTASCQHPLFSVRGEKKETMAMDQQLSDDAQEVAVVTVNDGVAEAKTRADSSDDESPSPSVNSSVIATAVAVEEPEVSDPPAEVEQSKTDVESEIESGDEDEVKVSITDVAVNTSVAEEEGAAVAVAAVKEVTVERKQVARTPSALRDADLTLQVERLSVMLGNVQEQNNLLVDQNKELTNTLRRLTRIIRAACGSAAKDGSGYQAVAAGRAAVNVPAKDAALLRAIMAAPSQEQPESSKESEAAAASDDAVDYESYFADGTQGDEAPVKKEETDAAAYSSDEEGIVEMDNNDNSMETTTLDLISADEAIMLTIGNLRNQIESMEDERCEFLQTIVGMEAKHEEYCRIDEARTIKIQCLQEAYHAAVREKEEVTKSLQQHRTQQNLANAVLGGIEEEGVGAKVAETSTSTVESNRARLSGVFRTFSAVSNFATAAVAASARGDEAKPAESTNGTSVSAGTSSYNARSSRARALFLDGMKANKASAEPNLISYVSDEE
jgi:hypothetical protein